MEVNKDYELNINENDTKIKSDKTISFHEYEQELKRKYYKSNPLKNYAPTRGQSIIPEQIKNIKKPLPKIFNELRITKDIEEDRLMHMQKLRSNLKVNLNLFDPNKNPIDCLENSKKIYSDYCKYNLTKPIDLTNVESILKQNLKLKNTKISNTNTNTNTNLLNDNSNSNSTSLYSFDDYEKPYHLSKAADLLIDAQMIDFKSLQDLNQEIRNHKYKLAKLNINLEDKRDAKFKYRILKSSSSNKSNNQNNITNQHKGTIYNYRQAMKSFNSQTRISSATTNFPSSVINDENYETKKTLSKLNSNSLVDNRELINQQHNALLRDYEYLKGVLYSASMTNQARYKSRIKNARDKILNEHVEKHNLNKMTILQPFEETKILINIDQVPSGFLNSLLNKEHIAPRYYIPPIRAYGYFKKVTEPVEIKTTSVSTMSMFGSKSAKNERKKHMANINANEIQQAGQHNFTLESLKSLSENNQNYTLYNKEASQTSNNFTSNSNANFDLKVDTVKKDVSVK